MSQAALCSLLPVRDAQYRPGGCQPAGHFEHPWALRMLKTSRDECEGLDVSRSDCAEVSVVEGRDDLDAATLSNSYH